MLEGRRLHLLAQQFLIDQAVEHGAAIVVSELGERATVEQGFVAQGFIPIALENNVAVHRGDDAVDDLPGLSGHADADEQRQRHYRDCLLRIRTNAFH